MDYPDIDDPSLTPAERRYIKERKAFEAEWAAGGGYEAYEPSPYNGDYSEC